MAFSSPGVFVEEVPSAIASIAGASTSTAGFVGIFDDTVNLVARNPSGSPATQVVTFTVPTPANVAVLVTNFTEFANAFGGFTGPDDGTSAGSSALPNTAHRDLAQAVFGFFANGGSRCYVVRAKTAADVNDAIDVLDAIDEVAIVAAPGQTSDDVRSKLITHCEALKDRFAILDGPAHVDNLDNLKTPSTQTGGVQPPVSNYAAWYYPWLNVFDPAEKLANPSGTGTVQAPPSGHVAGIYARVDTQRGVFKSPANEVVRGALSLTHPLSRAKQDGLNPFGVNLIRDINGAITVWGARTIGGNANGDLKYISTRRTLSFIRESIDEGLQWSVFEPNTPILWAKIRRNVEAFLTTLWRAGGLFGATPQDAFFVKCDAENNQPQDREQGTVNTDVGVAIVRPAEFVVFRISQQQPTK